MLSTKKLYFVFLEIMDCSERTKQRKISARVEEHFRFLENDSIEPLDDFLAAHDISTDTFYDVCDHSEFENLVHNAEDENDENEPFYDALTEVDFDFENEVSDDGDCDLDIESDHEDDTGGLATVAEKGKTQKQTREHFYIL